jgi:hypothetical protein
VEAFLAQHGGPWLESVVDKNWNVTGYKLKRSIPPVLARAALDLLESSSAPLPREILIRELVRCQRLTKGKAENEDDQVLFLESLSEELAEWPGDICFTVLRQWPRTSMWHPSLRELLELGAPELKHRNALNSILSRSLGVAPKSLVEI